MGGREGSEWHSREPRPGGAEQDLTVLPLTDVVAEVGPGGLGSLDLVDDLVLSVGVEVTGVDDGVDIGGGTEDVSLDIEGVSGRLRDGKSEVKRD